MQCLLVWIECRDTGDDIVVGGGVRGEPWGCVICRWLGM